LIRFLVGFETIYTARDAQTAERLPPRNGIGLVAGRGGKRIRPPGAPADTAINLFLDVDGRLFHDVFSIGRTGGQRKDAEKAREENADRS